MKYVFQLSYLESERKEYLKKSLSLLGFSYKIFSRKTFINSITPDWYSLYNVCIGNYLVINSKFKNLDIQLIKNDVSAIENEIKKININAFFFCIINNDYFITPNMINQDKLVNKNVVSILIKLNIMFFMYIYFLFYKKQITFINLNNMLFKYNYSYLNK